MGRGLGAPQFHSFSWWGLGNGDGGSALAHECASASVTRYRYTFDNYRCRLGGPYCLKKYNKNQVRVTVYQWSVL